MIAKIEKDYLTIKHSAKIDGITCCVVDCLDYDNFKTLPPAISYNNTLCGKSGWNSDKSEAYYQSNTPLVRIAK